MTTGFRTEHDSMGEVQVPDTALFGAQTQRATQNFRIAPRPMPRGFIEALGLIKAEVAHVHGQLGLLEPATAQAIADAALAVADGQYDAHFPVPVFQTGSGTSSNMNANEVIARLASDRLGRAVHPNDEVNMGQSSNDVVPTALHLGAALALSRRLFPALDHLHHELTAQAARHADVVKTGRTHLMDALPITLGQEIGAWAAQIDEARERLRSTAPRIETVALGATAVGTGVNADARVAPAVVARLSERLGLGLTCARDRFMALACQDAAVELSGQLRAAAIGVYKIANDLRWMNSGPLAGLGEIRLPALQPGSSIMPGKVNPVIPEAVAMACASIVGRDAAIAFAGSSGSFQLNVMLPLIASELLAAIETLAGACRELTDRAVAGFEVNHDNLERALAHNPILVTALNTEIGYERGAAIAKRAYAQGRPILEVAMEMTDLDQARLRELLDPARLTGR